MPPNAMDIDMPPSSWTTAPPLPPPPPPPPPSGPPLASVRLIEFPAEPSSSTANEESVAQKETPSLGAVVVTTAQSQSYDALFRTVQQKGEDGEAVHVYDCCPDSLQYVVECLKTGQVDSFAAECTAATLEAIKRLADDIKELDDPDAVVFNYECCGGCSEGNFNMLMKSRQQSRKHSNEKTFEHIEYFLSCGYMVMCSDFSLKALIHNWDAAKLGPNPFLTVGTTGQPVKLRFNAATLKECPSAQLSMVGDLLPDSDYVICATMSDTIVYTVKDPAAHAARDANSTPIPAPGCPYTLEVLTVAEKSGMSDPCVVDGAKGEKHSGSAGHCLLTYPSGGKLLTSMTHWMELVKLEVSETQLFSKARDAYGERYAAEKMQEYSALSSEGARRSYRASAAREYVQQSAPSMSKAKKSKMAYLSKMKKASEEEEFIIIE